MNDDESATTREMVKETRTDVKWIKEALTEIKTVNEKQDDRITNLENANSHRIGRDGAIAAAIAAVVAFFTALVSGGWFR